MARLNVGGAKFCHECLHFFSYHLLPKTRESNWMSLESNPGTSSQLGKQQKDQFVNLSLFQHKQNKTSVSSLWESATERLTTEQIRTLTSKHEKELNPWSCRHEPAVQPHRPKVPDFTLKMWLRFLVKSEDERPWSTSLFQATASSKDLHLSTYTIGAKVSRWTTETF